MNAAKEKAPACLEIRAGQHSEAGVKPSNEDCCGIRVPESRSLVRSKGICAVVADGVSSSEAGRAAAETCVQGLLQDYYSTPESWTVKTSVQKVMGALNRWLYGRGQSQFRSGQGMLSTCSVAVFKSATVHIFHVGDTRISRLRGEEFTRLTRDHQTWSGGDKAFLNRAMGADLQVDIDYRSESLAVGDVFFLTTDGVHEYLSAEEMVALYREHGEDPEAAARAIVEAALAAGSLDNATCQVIEVTSIPDLDEQAFYRQLTALPFPPALSPGQRLDGYRIQKELHASHRTHVYLAVEEASGRQVVLKAPSVNFEDDAEYIDAFLHEEWAGRRIDNPHVVKVLDPPTQRSCLYYVTEYVRGQTLRQWMNDHPRPSLLEVRELVEQMAAGLRAFHRLEMIHQDLKPENVLIDTEGTVKLVDFGSTRIAGIEEIAKPVRREHPLGTESYVAPEYLQGYPGSSVSDLFSLGVIAYEMLTGRLPYDRVLKPGNLKQVRYQSAIQFNPEVPAWMDGALRKAVHIDPRRRYQHLSEFVHDLSHPNPELVKDTQAPLIERDPVKFWRGLSALLLLVNLILLALLVGG